MTCGHPDSAKPLERRSHSGSLIVEASDLEVGDPMQFTGTARPVWWPIAAIDDKPRTRAITLNAGYGQRPVIRVRKMTLGRALRKDER